MSISKNEALYIAKLSKLKLSDKEIEEYTTTLSSIVDFANQLSNVDVSNIEPTAHILNKHNVFRKDKLKPSYDREKILQNAPVKDAGCIVVPKVMEEE